MIIIGLVAALLLTGVAFAAWTAQVDINVNAGSGELDVEITNSTIGTVSPYVDFASGDITVSADKKTATVEIDNLYPDASAEFSITITNVGTLPVKLDKIAHNSIEIVDKDTGVTMGRDAAILAQFEAVYSVSIVDTSAAVLDTLPAFSTDSLASFTEDVYTGNSLMAIEPGDTVVIPVTVSLKSTATDSSENKTFRFSITPLFVQAN